MPKPTFTLGLTLLASGLLPYATSAGEVSAPPPATATAANPATKPADAPAEKLRDHLQPGLSSDAVRRYANCVTLVRMGDTVTAVEQLRKLTIDYPSYYNALVLLARHTDFNRERKAALEAMKQALKVQQDEKFPDPEAAYQLGLMYMNMDVKYTQDALEAFQAGLTLEATNTPKMNGLLHNSVAACYLLLGQEEKGMEHHRIAAEKYGNEISARRLAALENKAEINKTLNRADRAIKPGVKTGYDITTTLPLPPEAPGDAKSPVPPLGDVAGPITSDRKPKKDPRSTAEKFAPFEEVPEPKEADTTATP